MKRSSVLAITALLAVAVFSTVTLVALEGGDVVVLRTKKVDGGWRETRVWVAKRDDAMLIEAATPERPFFLDLRREPTAQLVIDGVSVAVRTEVLPQPDGHLLIRRLLREKYGWADVWIGLLANTDDSRAVRITSADGR